MRWEPVAQVLLYYAGCHSDRLSFEEDRLWEPVLPRPGTPLQPKTSVRAGCNRQHFPVQRPGAESSPPHGLGLSSLHGHLQARKQLGICSCYPTGVRRLPQQRRELLPAAAPAPPGCRGVSSRAGGFLVGPGVPWVTVWLALACTGTFRGKEEGGAAGGWHADSCDEKQDPASFLSSDRPSAPKPRPIQCMGHMSPCQCVCLVFQPRKNIHSDLRSGGKLGTNLSSSAADCPSAPINSSASDSIRAEDEVAF